MLPAVHEENAFELSPVSCPLEWNVMIQNIPQNNKYLNLAAKEINNHQF